MVRKKVDDRVRTLIENGVKTHHRSLLVLVGDHGKDQVVNLHYILSRTQVKARPSVLWCYKNELGFSTHRKKRMRQIKRQVQRGLHDPDKDDPFDLFVSSTNVRWCYYKETHRILGQTFGMCVLQDFEALTPNLLARTVETVEGGGLVVLLLRSVNSLKQLYTMTMDVHARFRTEAHGHVVARFNERFVLSLGDCNSCLVLDDELNVLPLSKAARGLTALPGSLDDGVMRSGADEELKELQELMLDRQPMGALISIAKTVDQAKAVMAFMEAVQEKTLRTTVSLTASRGRGKSAAVGLCLAGAIAFGYSNIYVTAPSPENLETVFDFVKRGLAALKYAEHMDYEVRTAGHHGGHSGGHQQGGQQGQADAKAIVRITVHRQHRQTIQYIAPHEHEKLSQAELVAIDEAAAIPLPLVKRLIGNYLVFMSSTVTGYEGTGRSLSLKLIQQLREQQGRAMAAVPTAQSGQSSVRKLREVTLEDPIRYGRGDPVEKWLHHVLCLDANLGSQRLLGSVMPPADQCRLYAVDRDTLFSYHKVSEAFLQRVMALYTAAHYKNQPNDLQLLSDAPAHKLYVLLGPGDQGADKIPDVLCVIQVSLEGRISKDSVQANLARGHRASGDLIPWNISQQFQDSQFANLSGARIVRIAAHPDAQRMGYGTRALQLLMEHFEGKRRAKPGKGMRIEAVHETPGEDSSSGGEEDEEESGSEEEGEGGGKGKKLLRETVTPRKQMSPLLVPVEQVEGQERLHWLGTSFGLTEALLGFWARSGLRLVYMRQTANDLTGEHTVVMLRSLDTAGMEEAPEEGWLGAFTADALRRIVSLLSFEFRDSMDTTLDLAIIDNLRAAAVKQPPITPTQLGYMLVPRDFERLQLYARNLVDYHMITDLLPTLSRLYFLGLLPESVRLSHLLEAILLGLGLRHRRVDPLARELGIDGEQLLAMFNKVVRKIGGCLQQIHDEGKKAASKEAKPSAKPSDKPPEKPSDKPSDKASEGGEGSGKKKKKRRRPSEDGGKGKGEEQPEEEVKANGAAAATEEGEGGPAQDGDKKKKKKKKRKVDQEEEEEASPAKANGAVNGEAKKEKAKKHKYKNLG